jgi:hypothetical protein
MSISDIYITLSLFTNSTQFIYNTTEKKEREIYIVLIVYMNTNDGRGLCNLLYNRP